MDAGVGTLSFAFIPILLFLAGMIANQQGARKLPRKDENACDSAI
jgi:hypothetical protein